VNLEQTAIVLARIQLIDNRRVDEEVIREWHLYLEDVADVPAALEAITMHRMESREWLMPVDIRRGVDRIRDAAITGRTDEWGNLLESDGPAVAALARLGRAPREIES